MARYKFISWNVNGVRAVDKKEALKWIDEHDVHLLGLQETKSMKEQIPKTIFNKQYRTMTASASAIKEEVELPYLQILKLHLNAPALLWIFWMKEE